MKHRYHFFLVLISLFFVSCHSFQSSHDLTKTERIAGLAKAWGVLKYHHPYIFSGRYHHLGGNWDEDLLQWIPRFEKAEGRKEYNQLLQDLIDSLGELDWEHPEKKERDTSLLLLNNPLEVIHQGDLFDAKISEQLERICREYGTHPLPVFHDFLGGFFSNDIAHPSREVRLQSLIYCWNQLQYFFPHHEISDSDWNSVLMEFIPLFEAAEDSIEYHLTILKLAKKLDDSHAFVFESPILDAHFGKFFPPFKVDFIGGKTVVSSYYLDRRSLRSIAFRTYFSVESLGKLSGVNVGDEIVAVNGMPIQTIRDSLRTYVGASNLPTLERNINSLVLCGKTDSVTLEVFDGKNAHTTAIKRYTVNELRTLQMPFETEPWRLISPEIGYIDMARISPKKWRNPAIPNQFDTIFNDFQSTQAIIFDCRSYPSVLSFQLLSYLTQDTSAFALFYGANARKAGYFSKNYHLNKAPKENHTPYAGQIVVLVNANTQSAGEYLCMQLQAANERGAIVIGSQTAGADGMVNTVHFAGDFKLYYTGHAVFYPDGKPTQRVGIVPDIEVLPTVEGLRTGKDEVLLKAVGYIEGGVL